MIVRDEAFEEWANNPQIQDEVFIIWQEGLDFGDMPQDLQDECQTDDVDEWENKLIAWIEGLTFNDIPDDWLQQHWENMNSE